MRAYESPQLLINYVSTVKDTLRLQETFRGKVSYRNELHLLNNPNVYRRSTPVYILLFNFIMNRVPSDLYRVKNPQLVIVGDSSKQTNDSFHVAASPGTAPALLTQVEALGDDEDEDGQRE